MLQALRRFGMLLALTADKCARDNTPYMAAAISFYAILSLAPALWIVVAAAGQFVGRQSARAAALDWVSEHVGVLAARSVGDIVDKVNESSRLATIGGALAVALAATGAFAALRSSLNRIWNIQDPPVEGIWAGLRAFARNFVATRLLAFVAMLVLGILLLASLVAGAVLTFISRYMPAGLPAPKLLLNTANFTVSAMFMVLLFASIYALLHRQSFAHREIWVGAAVTACLIALGNALIGPYLGGAGIRSAYGAAGSFVLLLLWVYYSTQILLFGAAFTDVYARSRQRE